MIVTGDIGPARGRPGGFDMPPSSLAPDQLSQVLAGSGMVRPLFPFQDRRAGRAAWAGVVVGSRRKATRLAHLWQAHRLIAEARGKAIRAKRTEQNPTN